MKNPSSGHTTPLFFSVVRDTLDKSCLRDNITLHTGSANSINALWLHTGPSAAAILGTSQPALSRLIADMQICLGAALFDRTSRPWRMTTLGESLASQGSAIRVALSRASHTIDQFKGGIEGLLNKLN